MEDVQQANEVLRKNDPPPVDPSTTASSASTTTSLLDRYKSFSEDKKSQDGTDSVPNRTSSDKDIYSRLSGDVNLRRTNSSMDSDSSSISSWRRNRDVDTSKKEASMTIKFDMLKHLTGV